MKIVATIMVLISIIIVGAFMICDYNGYFDIRKIIKQYKNVFHKSRFKIIFIYIVLLVLSIGIGIIEIINNDLIDSITLIISILCGAFLAFIPIVIDLQSKKIASMKKDIYINVCDETKNVLMFELLMSVVELFFCFVYMFIYPKINIEDKVYSIIMIIFSSWIYYLAFVILLNILLILKRITILIDFQRKNTP